jgi:hypothetical protein
VGSKLARVRAAAAAKRRGAVATAHAAKEKATQAFSRKAEAEGQLARTLAAMDFERRTEEAPKTAASERQVRKGSLTAL